MKGKLNHWLDCCRSSAILLVLLSHGRIFLTPVFPDAQMFKFGGFLGVELFFALSGFLIGKILLDKLDNAKTAADWIVGFWCRRWLRTYPSYLLFLAINILIIHTIRPDIFPGIIRYLTFTQSLLNPHPSFFGEAWSLAVEEVFYFMTPLLLAFFMWVTHHRKAALYASVLLLVLIPILLRIHAAIDTDLSFNEIRATALYRIDSIMYGVLAIIYFKKYGSTLLDKSGTVLIPICIYIAAQDDLFMDNSILLKVFLFPMANIGCAFLICAGFNWILNSKVMVIFTRVARWSYAAYLTNLPALFLIKHLLAPPTTLASCLLQWGLYFMLTLCTAWMVYSMFERQVLKFRDKLIAS